MFVMMSATMTFADLYETKESETLKVWFDDFTIVPDGKTVTYVTIYESDLPENNYTAFNMTFFVPKGIKIHQVKQGREMVNDIKLSERAASTHSIACNLLDDGTTLRVIADSTNNDDFYPDDESGNKLDEIYTIGLIGEEGMEEGTYQMEMTGIKFIFSDGNACVPVDDHVYRTVTVKNDSQTAIEDIDIDKEASECYTLDGLKVKGQPTQGTVIIRDGKKLLTK